MLSERAKKLLTTQERRPHISDEAQILAALERAGLPVFEKVIEFQKNYGGYTFYAVLAPLVFGIIHSNPEAHEPNTIDGFQGDEDEGGLWYFDCVDTLYQMSFWIDQDGRYYEDGNILASSIDQYIEQQAHLAELSARAKSKWRSLFNKYISADCVDHFSRFNLVKDELASDQHTSFWYSDVLSVRVNNGKYCKVSVQHVVDINAEYLEEIKKFFYSKETWAELNIEIIRARPNMYGGTDKRALHELVFRIVTNSLNQFKAGLSTTITITLGSNNTVTIADDGSGIPVAPVNLGSQRPALELIFAGFGKYNAKTNTFHQTYFRGQSIILCTLSTALKVVVKRDGFVWQQKFSVGRPTSELIQLRPMLANEHTGTSITFTPDFSIMEQNDFDVALLSEYIAELAALNAGVTITLRDERTESPQEHTFRFADGIADYVSYLQQQHPEWGTSLHTPITTRIDTGESIHSIQGDTLIRETLIVELFIQYFSGKADYEETFSAKGYKTIQAQAHIFHLRKILYEFLNQYAVECGALVEGDPSLSYHEAMAGLVIVVNLPTLYGKPYVIADDHPTLKHQVADATLDALKHYVETQPQQMRMLIDGLIGQRFNTID